MADGLQLPVRKCVAVATDTDSPEKQQNTLTSKNHVKLVLHRSYKIFSKKQQNKRCWTTLRSNTVDSGQDDRGRKREDASAFSKEKTKTDCIANEQTCMPPKESSSVLRKVHLTFVQYMYPTTVLDVMSEEELLPPEILRDIKESGTTSDINRKLLQCIQSRNTQVFNKFKECLHETGQGLLLALLKTAEKGEDTTEIKRKIELQSHHDKVFQEMQQIVKVSNRNKRMCLCYAYAHLGPKVFKSLLEENIDLEKPAEEIESSWTVVGYLRKHEQKLKLTPISDNQKKMLYPADASVPDLDAWGVSLFCFVLSETCSFDEEIAKFLQLMRDQDQFFSNYTENNCDERFAIMLTLLKKCICEVKDPSVRLALLAELDLLEAGVIPGTDLALVRKAVVQPCEDVKKATRDFHDQTRAHCTNIGVQTLTAVEKGNKSIEEKLDYLIDCENAKKSNKVEECKEDDCTSDMCSCKRVKSRRTGDFSVVINDSTDDSGSSEAADSGCASQINLEELVKTVTKSVVSSFVQTGFIQDPSSVDDLTTQSAARSHANQTRTVLSGGPSHQVEKLENDSIASFKVMINNCCKETEAMISDLCVEKINNINAENALCSSQIAEAIQSTLLKFRDKGQTIVKAELGCIQLHVQCSSVESVFTLLRDYETGGLDDSFHTLQNALRTIDGCEDIELETLMYEEEVNAILSQLGTRILCKSSYDDISRRWANNTTSEEELEHCGNASSEINKDLRRVKFENVCDASDEMKRATSTSRGVPEDTRVLCGSSYSDVSRRWANTTPSEEKLKHCGNTSSDMNEELSEVKLENGCDASAEIKTATSTSPDAPEAWNNTVDQVRRTGVSVIRIGFPRRWTTRHQKGEQLVGQQISTDGNPCQLICIFNLRGKCAFAENCRNFHSDLPYQWLYKKATQEQWKELPPAENLGMELSFSDPNNQEYYMCLENPLGVKVSFRTLTGVDGFGHSFDVCRLSTSSSVEFENQPLTTVWLWYWKGQIDEWKMYGESRAGYKSHITSTELEQAYLANPEGQLAFSTLGHEYILDFQHMLQRSLKYKTEREVCRRPQFVSKQDVEEKKKQLFKQGGHRKAAGAGIASVKPLHLWNIQAGQDLLDHCVIAHLSAENPLTNKEYKEIEALFCESLPSNVSIKSIERIENGDLWSNYVSKKMSMVEKNGGNDVEERRLFYGTQSKYVTAICRQGFDFRLSGQTSGTRFGKGSYFATTAKYSDCYTDQTDKAIFVVKVLVGDYTQGRKNYVRPPKKDPGNPFSDFYDSCVDSVTKPSIFVIFDNSGQVYPEYLVKYEYKYTM